MSVVIRGARLLEPSTGQDGTTDVSIRDGRVAEIKERVEAQPGDEVIDAAGLWLMPGLVDTHAHVPDPGHEYREDWSTAARTAAAGGFTAVQVMADSEPAVDDVDRWRDRMHRAALAQGTRFLSAGALTVGRAGERLAALGELAQAGALAVSDAPRWLSDASLMRSALEYANDFGLVVVSRCEDPALARGGVMHEGAMSTQLGLPGSPRVAEDSALARDLFLAEYLGARLHVTHVSTAGAVELVRQAKGRGALVTASCTPHHATTSVEALSDFPTAGRVRPPLRDRHDVVAVVAGLADGTLDAVATDHTPLSGIEKSVCFAEALPGTLGWQTALPLMLQLVEAGHLAPLRLVELLTSAPADIFGLEYGRLVVSSPADVVLVDPEARWQLDANTNQSRSANALFWETPLKGRVLRTWVDGVTVFDGAAADGLRQVG